MAKYTIMHTCGHTERVDLVGHHTSREWRIKQLEQQECYECYKLHEVEVAHAIEQEQELPALQGTEKQIAWASVIRAEKLKALDVELASMTTSTHDLLQAIEYVTTQTSAHLWIEWRDEPIRSILYGVHKMLQATPIDAYIQQQDTVKRDALVEATVRPEKPVTETIAEIHIKDDTIEILFPEKRDDFRELVRNQLDYSWLDNRWKRTIVSRNGTVEDRAAELGHTLLASGFSIRIFQENIRQKAITGSFKPECTRWITTILAGAYTGWFTVLWGKREDFYQAAKRLKRSRYVASSIVVPPEQFEEVLDFAQLYDFKISSKAMEVAEQARTVRDTALTVKVERLAKKQKEAITDTPTLVII